MMRFADRPRRPPAPRGTVPVRASGGLVVLPATPAGRLDLALAGAIADRQRAGEPVDVSWRAAGRRHAVLRIALAEQPAVAVALAFEGLAPRERVEGGRDELALAVDGGAEVVRLRTAAPRGARGRFERQAAAASAPSTRSAAASGVS